MSEADEWESIDVSTDSDYAGCRVTRKSTPGGVGQLGYHMIKRWSRMQGVVALSVGEAEYYALVKGACEGLGIQGLLRDRIHFNGNYIRRFAGFQAANLMVPTQRPGTINGGHTQCGMGVQCGGITRYCLGQHGRGL